MSDETRPGSAPKREPFSSPAFSGGSSPTRPYDRGSGVESDASWDTPADAFRGGDGWDDEPARGSTAELARTRAWDLGDPDAQTTADLDIPRGSGGSGGAAPRGSDEPTTPLRSRIDDRVEERHAPAPRPARSHSAPRRATAPAPAPAPAPVAPPSAPYGPYAGYGGAAAYPGFPLEGPGPGALSRFGSVVLCLGLTALSAALLVFGVIGAVVEAQAAITGAAGTGAPTLLIVCSVIAMFGAALTARISGLGPVLAGILLLVLSGLTLAFPHLLVSLLRSGLESGQLTADGPLGDIVTGIYDDAVTTVLTSAGALVATMGLMMGATLLAAGMAVHGARRSGWRRGSGR